MTEPRFRRIAPYLAAAGFALGACHSSPPTHTPTVGAAPPMAGFTRASADRTLHFPADHGSHPDYQSEWWYFTGNLRGADDRHFGYQLTFFRRALLPPAQRAERESEWAAEQVYMAHFAVTDVAGGRLHAFETFSRGAAGLAGVQTAPFRVWLDDWSVGDTNDALSLTAQRGEVAVELRLQPLRGPVAHGRAGYSQKGPDPGNASHYYSMPLLATAGSMRIGDERFAVSGESWMDHEFGTSALAPDQVGWDWFSLQLDDGSQIMLFQIRNAAGDIDPFSSATFMPAAGPPLPLSRRDFSLQVTDTWESPKSGAEYPAEWHLVIPAAEIDLVIEPRLAEQELVLAYVYWEGCVAAHGRHANEAVRGSGYAELTGYAVSMENQL